MILSKSKVRYSKQHIKKELEWLSFILPTVVCLLVLTYWPTFQAIRYSFYDVSVIGFNEKFVGFRNYGIILSNNKFLLSVWNTVYLGMVGLLVIPFGFFLASAINSLRKGKLQTIFRLGFYLPNIITGVSIILIFQYILQVDNGMVNAILSMIFNKKIQIGWLSDPDLAKIGASIISIWASLGYNMLICLAGLQSIPNELYEAAMVDGASSFRRLRHITIPSLRGTFVFLFITGIINSFSRFTDLFILSGSSAAGRPYGALQSILMFIYQYSFDNPAYGFACAGSIILFILVMSVTCVNLKVTKLL